MAACAMRARRGQAVVEVLALVPLVVACTLAFVAAAFQLVAMARAESALSDAVAADVAGTSVRGALHGRARLVSADATSIVIDVAAPLGDVRLQGERVR